MIRNLIFDWSGTLVDDLTPVLEATNRVFAAHGKAPLSRQAFREKFYLPYEGFYKEHLPQAPLQELETIFREVFRELHHTVTLLPGAREILEYCHSRDLSVFLLSTVHEADFEEQSRRLGVNHFFREAYAGVPDKRDAIHGILKDHNLRPEETLFIGDMEHDIATARHGGIRSCAVLTGYDSLAKLQKALPDHIAPDMYAVAELIRRHSVPEPLPPTPTVGALIVGPAGKILMLHTLKWSGLWGIPGGKIKPGEPAEKALRREVLEETGLKITGIEFALVQDCIRSREFYKPAHFILLNYLAKTSQKKVILNPEADDYRWCTLKECYQLKLNTPTRILLDWYKASKPKLGRA